MLRNFHLSDMKVKLLSAVYGRLSASLILVLGLGLTFAATAWVGRWEHLNRQNAFQRQIDNLTTGLQRTINRYSELLLS